MSVTVKPKAGQVVTLSATTGPKASAFRAKIEAGWDPNKDKLGINPKTGKPNKLDVDISLVFRDLKGEAQALCYYDDLTPFPGVEHSADDEDGTTSDGGADEFIKVVLDGTAPHPIVDVFCNVYEAIGRNQSFAIIDNCFVQVVNETSGDTIRIEPAMDLIGSSEVGMWVARFYLEGNQWKLVQVAEKFDTKYTDLQAFADQILPKAK